MVTVGMILSENKSGGGFELAISHYASPLAMGIRMRYQK